MAEAMYGTQAAHGSVTFRFSRVSLYGVLSKLAARGAPLRYVAKKSRAKRDVISCVRAALSRRPANSCARCFVFAVSAASVTSAASRVARARSGSPAAARERRTLVHWYCYWRVSASMTDAPFHRVH